MGSPEQDGRLTTDAPASSAVIQPPEPPTPASQVAVADLSQPTSVPRPVPVPAVEPSLPVPPSSIDSALTPAGPTLPSITKVSQPLSAPSQAPEVSAAPTQQPMTISGPEDTQASHLNQPPQPPQPSPPSQIHQVSSVQDVPMSAPDLIMRDLAPPSPTSYDQERELRERDLRERQARERELQERELQERELRERELREQDFRQRELRERQMREREIYERDIREREIRERELNERELRERDLRDQELRERALRDQELRERDLHERSLRERELRDREARERERIRHQDEISRREQEQRERDREQREQHQREPTQFHTGSIPIHQPVASKVATTIHGPGGLLSSTATGVPTLGTSPGPGSMFGGPLQPMEGPPQMVQLAPAPPLQQAPPQHQPLPYTANVGNHPMSGHIHGLSQGQQPILNDALSYLDQVKVQFVDQPDVYNRFLDIMKDFKSQAIDTPGVIDRVSSLFAGHPNLIQGFNTFLPPGYRIECGAGNDPNAIRVTTPMGTTVSSMNVKYQPSSQAHNPAPAPSLMAPSARQPSYYDQVSKTPGGGWQQQQQAPLPPSQQQQQPPQPQQHHHHHHHHQVHQQQAVGVGQADALYPTNDRVAAPAYSQQQVDQSTGQNVPVGDQVQRDQQLSAAAAAQQQEQRAVSQLQSAMSAAVNGQQPRNVNTPTGQSQSSSQGVAALNSASQALQQSAQANLEKRGPVEFNHAISYVNKIKNRFATQPEIYKQFLEILQTYQRESKPIQDVYAQVTHLFNSAPDLLEDFKQFLPESAAHAKKQEAAKQAAEDAVMMSNVRSEPDRSAGTPTPIVAHSLGPHRTEMKMPPVGNFPPPSVTKEHKKRRAPPTAQGHGATAQAGQNVPGMHDGSQGAHGSRAGFSHSVHGNKRAKLHYTKPVQPELPVISPTLTPALPQPLPPTVSTRATSEEIAFFDRVKKYIGNKQTMNEFLKLCNLFSQDLIDKNLLVRKVSGFIGGNAELIAWFKRFVAYDGKDEMVENRARSTTGRIALSSCRGYGPSYRLLPKRERLKPCSGRDEMCNEVLNDEWASHPTWASEDSGFVAHRKNIYEEGLHRIEEERHDYDFNIESNFRTIQLLEPIAQQIALMTEEERVGFTLSPGIGGQSTAIYQRVIKKLYDRERGQRVLEDLFTRPCAVVPIVLNRLKQKDEEWKASQREWEKVWREQTQKMFYRSLDHMGINSKSNDKKLFLQKTLISEIQTRLEEQKRPRQGTNSIPPEAPTHQLEYLFEDRGVVLDAIRIMLVFVELSNNFNQADRQKISPFLRTFMAKFFGFTSDEFEEGVKNVLLRSPIDDDLDDAASGEPSVIRTRRNNLRRTDLRRGVLERGRTGKPGREQDNTDSKESTPDIHMEDATDAEGTVEDDTVSDPADDNWTALPGSGLAHKLKSHGLLTESHDGKPAREIASNEPFRRESYSLYCNANVYCLMRVFQIFYSRLSRVKGAEDEVVEQIRRAQMPKPAHELRLVDKMPEDFFRDTGPDANYYAQIVEMCQEVMGQQMDVSQFDTVLRQYYMQTGWQLYGMDRLLGALSRFALLIVAGDVKDKGTDIVNLFYKNREKQETTHQVEISYRMHVEKLVKEGEVYRIVYNEPSTRTTMQILKKEDSTFDHANMSDEEKWSYYTASYVKVEPTEGVPIGTAFWLPFLRRDLRRSPADLSAAHGARFTYGMGLVLKICVNSYKMLYEPGSTDWFVQGANYTVAAQGRLARAVERRRGVFEKRFAGARGLWTAGIGREEARERDAKVRELLGMAPDEEDVLESVEKVGPEEGGGEGQGKADEKTDEKAEEKVEEVAQPEPAADAMEVETAADVPVKTSEEPATELLAKEPLATPIPEPVASPLSTPAAESAPEPTADPVAEPTADAVPEPTAEDAVAKPEAAPATETEPEDQVMADA